jgi:hypothetical protein
VRGIVRDCEAFEIWRKHAACARRGAGRTEIMLSVGDGPVLAMTHARKAQILTVAALALALAVAIGRREASTSSGTAPSQPSAQDTIYAMLAASRAGNVRAYLENYAGEMRASLAQSIRESGEELFGRYLKESSAAIKGVAVTQPQPVGQGETRVRVEYVYQDRNEAQTMYLQKTGGDWKIARVDGSERLKTLIPYGTPVR